MLAGTAWQFYSYLSLQDYVQGPSVLGKRKADGVEAPSMSGASGISCSSLGGTGTSGPAAHRRQVMGIPSDRPQCSGCLQTSAMPHCRRTWTLFAKYRIKHASMMSMAARGQYSQWLI